MVVVVVVTTVVWVAGANVNWPIALVGSMEDLFTEDVGGSPLLEARGEIELEKDENNKGSCELGGRCSSSVASSCEGNGRDFSRPLSLEDAIVGI